MLLVTCLKGLKVDFFFLIVILLSFNTHQVVSCFLFLADSPVYVPFPAKSVLKAPESSQILKELNVDDSPEEELGSESPSPPLRRTDTPPSTSSPTHQQTSLSPLLPLSVGSANVSQAPVTGVQQCLQRAKAAASTGQVGRPVASAPAEPLPPALPPKTRKVKVSGAPKVSEHSDRGDSDMDEETFSSSSQDKLRVKKVRHFTIQQLQVDFIIFIQVCGTHFVHKALLLTVDVTNCPSSLTVARHCIFNVSAEKFSFTACRHRARNVSLILPPSLFLFSSPSYTACPCLL